MLLVLLTLTSYGIGLWCYKKSNANSLSNPLLLASLVILTSLWLMSTPVEEYLRANQIVDWLLGPATVALAVPLYRHLSSIWRNRRMLLPILVGGLLAPLISLLFASLFVDELLILRSLLTRSVNNPFAIQIVESIGGGKSLAAIFIVISGIIGAVMANPLFNLLNCKSEQAKGLALGVTSHAVGTAQAIHISPAVAAYSMIGLLVNGLFSLVLLPLGVAFLL